jgi:hypothetical protein
MCLEFRKLEPPSVRCQIVQIPKGGSLPAFKMVTISISLEREGEGRGGERRKGEGKREEGRDLHTFGELLYD